MVQARDGNVLIVILAGFVAGTLATLAQVLLWVVAGEDAWTLLLRDVRFTAALVRGQAVLSPSTRLDAGLWLVATGIHFALSVIYAALLLRAAKRLALLPSLLVGAGFGALLYCVNLYGFAAIFRWFTEARSGITFVVHLVFGVAVMLSYRWLEVLAGRKRAA
jgi:hypothetical protein